MGLSERLADRGVAPPPWKAALGAVDRREHVADPYRDLAHVDAPLPEAEGVPGFSPRGAVLALRALDVGGGDDVLVVGPGGTYVAALARARAGSAAHAPSLEEASGGPWDRILWTRETASPPTEAASRLEDVGTLLARVEAPDGVDVVKLVATDEGPAEVRLDEALPAEDPWGSQGEGPVPDRTLATLLVVEGALQRVWTDAVRGRQERRWLQAVEEVWRPDPPGDVPEARWTRARRLFRIGYVLQQVTDLETSREAYAASLAMAPSAEAYTFRGWVESFRGRYQEAIEDCERAIEVDPTLGNPYNDIGCYLLELGEFDEAEDWFHQAAEAQRYQAPHYPYLNLARVHLHRGEIREAEEAVERCLEIEPGDPAAEAILRRIRDERG